jgi:release factor glutamine methyltransferase
MCYPIKRVHLDDLVFDVCEEVYEPAEDSFLFAENLDVEEGAKVLDVGVGCGLLGVLAAKKADGVVAVDINPHAVRCARQNAKLNNVGSRMDFIQGDLFTALNPDTIFDLILFNAPYLPSIEGEHASWIGRAWAGGADGRQVIDRFITEVLSHLKPDGEVLLMQSTLIGVEETLRKFSQEGLKARVKARKRLPFFETLTLIEVKGNLKK